MYSFRYANVTNVLLRLSSPGGAPKRNALLINAHYDSALGTVAASDDAVMVALMLEVAENVVKSAAEGGTLLPHAIVFNFNGAEETNWQVREEGDGETGGRRRGRETERQGRDRETERQRVVVPHRL